MNDDDKRTVEALLAERSGDEERNALIMSVLERIDLDDLSDFVNEQLQAVEEPPADQKARMSLLATPAVLEAFTTVRLLQLLENMTQQKADGDLRDILVSLSHASFTLGMLTERNGWLDGIPVEEDVQP